MVEVAGVNKPLAQSTSRLEAQLLALLDRIAGTAHTLVDERVELLSGLSNLASAADRDRSEAFGSDLSGRRGLGPMYSIAADFFFAHLALRLEDLDLAASLCAHGRREATPLGLEAEIASFCIVQGTIHHKKGQYEAARIQFEEAAVASRRVGSKQLESRSEMNLGLVLKNTGDLVGAERLLRRACAGAAEWGSRTTLARCELNLTTVLIRRGEWTEAIELAKSARAGFEAEGLLGYANTALLAEARASRLRGEVSAAETLLKRALADAKQSDKPRNVILALEFLGDCQRDQGLHQEARELLREALVLARANGRATDLIVECLRGLAAAELGCGEAKIAQELATESVLMAREQGDTFELENSLLVLASAQRALGKIESSRESLAEARKFATQLGDRLCAGTAALGMAEIEQGSHARLEAIALASEARALALQLGASELLNDAMEVLDALTIDGASSLKPRGNQSSTAGTEASTGHVALASTPQGFVTRDPGVQRTLVTVATLAPQTLNILILGESGTGKELIAQAVHDQSGRKGPFVPVNCSAFPGDLIEGELFGHAKGAYTGADRERVGLFEFAHKGTLFLDEIGDMPVKAQARLLRALENGEVRRLGENSARTVDVRVVAATHRHLLEMVGAGEFRLDLYYRLAGYVVDLPPVRERRDDAKLLIDHFFARFADEQRKPLALSPELRQELAAHSWPGNVREIKMVMQRLVSLAATGATIRKLPFRLEGDPRPRSLPELLEAEERRRILDALQAHNWNKARAASSLGTNRTTLIGKMKRMGIELTRR
jgi:transcriptional regulator with GAF, ATPase, and Fis domain